VDVEYKREYHAYSIGIRKISTKSFNLPKDSASFAATVILHSIFHGQGKFSYWNFSYLVIARTKINI